MLRKTSKAIRFLSVGLNLEVTDAGGLYQSHDRNLYGSPKQNRFQRVVSQNYVVILIYVGYTTV